MMKTHRITIAGLIALIALSGLAMAALRSPSPLVAQIAVTFALTCLLIATLAAIVSANRAPAIGFTLFGWGYLFLVFGPGFADQVAPWMLSARILDELYIRTIETDGPRLAMFQAKSTSGGAFEGGALTNLMDGFMDAEFYQFRLIGHSLFAIAHGIFGGLLAVVLTKGQRRSFKELSTAGAGSERP